MKAVAITSVPPVRRWLFKLASNIGTRVGIEGVGDERKDGV